LRTFAVTGEGKAVAVPDVARFTFSVISEGGKNLDQLQSDNSRKAGQAIAYLKDNGVDEEDIQTSGFNVEPRYEYSSCRDGGVCPPPAIVGYTVRQTVTVKARDFETVGVLLSGVVNKGANSVSNLEFTLDNPEAPVNEAKAEAIEKAKERAKVMAKAGGFRLGRLISIEESGNFATPSSVYGKGMDMAVREEAMVAPTIEPGSQEITQSVTLRYEIK